MTANLVPAAVAAPAAPATPVAISLPAWQALAQHPWAYPALEAAHIVGIALLLGSLVVFEWRVWGRQPSVSPEALARLALPVSGFGFAIVVLTGSLMFSTQPAELIANRWFVAKIVLVGLAGANAVAFHLRGGVQRVDGMARLQTAISVGLWLGAIICGRWIAYA